VIVWTISHPKVVGNPREGDRDSPCPAHGTKFNRLFSILLFVFLLFQQLHPQEKLLPVFHFNHLTTADGLPTNEMRSKVVRDRQGFYWVGTANGLVRYDGYTFRVYRNNPVDSFSLSSNAINALLCDTKGRLWIGTWETGLSLYDPLLVRFHNFIPRPSDSEWLSGKAVFCINEDSHGNIWLGTLGGGITRLEIDNKAAGISIDTLARYIRFHTYTPGGRRNYIWSIKEIEDNRIAVASEGGLLCIDSLCRIVSLPNLSENHESLIDTAITT
jgi:hypothetical protein